MPDLIKLLLREKNLTKARAEQIKLNWAKSKKDKMLLSSAILEIAKPECSEEEYNKLCSALMTKPTRTLSGVAVIAVAAEPRDCPGKCIYCPKGANSPQSYTGFEPAIMRAIANKYDPYDQVKNRLKQLQDTGHSTEKCELIIMGGTFPAQDWDYQKQFVKRCFDAFNGKDSGDLVSAQIMNETAKNRVIGLTIETRPDYVSPKKLLELGCTRVELGIQSVYGAVLGKVKRGHTVQQTVKAIKQLKEKGFKILYQVMLGLPGSSLKKDIAMFKILFTDTNFKPDMLKIYPTLVVQGSELYNWWKAGKYKPIDEDYVLEVLDNIYSLAPKWVRIHRVQRDIPKEHISAGPIKSNLRQVLLRTLKSTKEIRFREAGQVFQRTGKLPENEKTFVEKYKASGGDEYFISIEDKKQETLLGFCRLRLAVSGKAFIRELHVYGETLPVAAERGVFQHAGRGKQLVAKAEEIVRLSGIDKIYIISGIGVKSYYVDKLGYRYDGYYVSKNL